MYCGTKTKARRCLKKHKMSSLVLQHAAATHTGEQRPVLDDLPLHFFSSAGRRRHAHSHLLQLQLPDQRLRDVLPHAADLHQRNTAVLSQQSANTFYKKKKEKGGAAGQIDIQTDNICTAA